MPVVHMHIDSAEALSDGYARVAGQVRDAMAEMSPLLTEALALLDIPGQHPVHGPLPALNETANGLREEEEDLGWRVDYMRTTDATFLRGSDRYLADMPNIQPPDAADIYNGTAKPPPSQLGTKTVDEPSMWDNFQHNILEGNSVIGSLITRRHTPQSIATITNNAGHVLDTLDNASTQIQSLNPTSVEGANLLLSDPGQFFENQRTFADGVVDWTVDTGTLAGALTIASNPAYNDAWLQHTGTDIRDEIVNSLRATAAAAAEDPDAFAATVVDWEGLEEDPIRWAGNQFPDVLIEVLTAGAGAAPLGGRRAANVIAEVADVADEVPMTMGSSASPQPSVDLQISDASRLTGADIDDLIPQQRQTHILDGDVTGGGHRWPGNDGKTPFPQGWDDSQILGNVADIATDPSAVRRNVTGQPGSLLTRRGRPSRHEVFGQRDGVCIRVILEPLGEGVITAHPIIGPCQ